jgi:Ser-tRNA(Ala) deacylase AlaX
MMNINLKSSSIFDLPKDSNRYLATKTFDNTNNIVAVSEESNRKFISEKEFSKLPKLAIKKPNIEAKIKKEIRNMSRTRGIDHI